MESPLYNSIILLHEYLAQIGATTSNLSDYEELDQIVYREDTIRTSGITSIDIDFYTRVYDIFGEAITLRYLLGDYSVFELNSSLTDLSLKKLRIDIMQSPIISVEIIIDKRTLIDRYYSDFVNSTNCYLYLYKDALVQFLQKSTLMLLESKLWRDTNLRVIILIPEYNTFISGNHLTILGGTI